MMDLVTHAILCVGIHAKMIEVAQQIFFDDGFDCRTQLLHRKWRVVGQVRVDTERDASCR